MFMKDSKIGKINTLQFGSDRQYENRKKAIRAHRQSSKVDKPAQDIVPKLPSKCQNNSGRHTELVKRGS